MTCCQNSRKHSRNDLNRRRQWSLRVFGLTALLICSGCQTTYRDIPVDQPAESPQAKENAEIASEVIDALWTILPFFNR
jgi:hypothetical protein